MATATLTLALTLAGLLSVPSPSHRTGSASEPKSMPRVVGTAIAAPDTPKDKDGNKGKSKLSCELLTKEAPRGGRLEVRGTAFGKSPLVRVGGKVARLIERRDDIIAVLIPRDSDGGNVTLHAGGEQATCGKLLIIGKK